MKTFRELLKEYEEALTDEVFLPVEDRKKCKRLLNKKYKEMGAFKEDN